MQVESLDVQRRPSYDTQFPNQLVGVVKLTNSQGSQEIRLSNAALSSIFNVITAEVLETAKRNARDVSIGMSNATSEPLLLSASKVEKDGDDIPF